jgi:hypothetical protein
MVQHLGKIMSFKENGFYVIENFLDDDFVKFINQYFFTRINAGQATLGDPQAPNSYSFYGDPLMDTILGESVEKLSEIAGYNLLPTYTYTRLYGKGDELKVHRDRPSCELSATLSLGYPNDENINPIFFSRNENLSDAVEIRLNPGDLCLYHGCDLYHWRPKFTQKWYLQSFLHYVNANGPFKDFLYDKRQYLGCLK